jgi:hypothetical protein
MRPRPWGQGWRKGGTHFLKMVFNRVKKTFFRNASFLSLSGLALQTTICSIIKREKIRAPSRRTMTPSSLLNRQGL